MSATHGTTARNAATDAVTALFGSGAKMKFRTRGEFSALGTVLAALTFSATAFAAAVAGVATANAITPDSSAAGSATLPARTVTLETSGGTVVIHCEVVPPGSDVTLSGAVFIAPGETVSCTSMTYSALNA
jgi:hypothetical protein